MPSEYVESELFDLLTLTLLSGEGEIAGTGTGSMFLIPLKDSKTGQKDLGSRT